MTTNRAFTLIEILVALMLTGLLSALALAPVVSTIRQTEQLRQDYSDITALERTMDFIARDLTMAVRLASNVLTVTDHEALGGYDDDILLIMSSAPNAQNLASGTVAYKLEDGGFMHSGILQGLYRWIVPGKIPNEVNTEHLEPEDAQLVLPYVSEFCVEIPAKDNDDNKKTYAGPLPEGVYIRIKRGERSAFSQPEEDTHNEYERYIALP